MTRLIALALCLALLAACGNDRNSRGQVVKTTLGNVFGGGGGDEAEAGQQAAPARELTRADVDKLGVALIRMRLAGDTARPIMTGATENGGYVSYISRFGPMLTLDQSLITASRGLGYDLLSVSSTSDDPIADPRPPGNWPRQTARTYRFPGPGPSGRSLPVTCTFAFGAPRTIEIVERTHPVVDVSETCTGEAVQFTNRHLADRGTGRVWQSTQWVGPEQGFIEIWVVEPFTDD